MSINNYCTFIGRLGADPELKSFGDNKSLIKFSIAVTEKYVDRSTGEIKKETTWVDLICFRPGLIKFISKTSQKGTKIMVVAKYSVQKYESEGEKKFSHQFIVEDFTPFDKMKPFEE